MVIGKARDLFLAIRLFHSFYLEIILHYHSAYITSFGGHYGKENCLGN